VTGCRMCSPISAFITSIDEVWWSPLTTTLKDLSSLSWQKWNGKSVLLSFWTIAL
jgi:hypothetical protein